MEELIKKISVLGEVTLAFHPETNTFSTRMDNVYGKPSYTHAISPTYHNLSLERAVTDYYHFLIGCDAIFVDVDKMTNVFHPVKKEFVFSTSYSNEVAQNR